MKYLKSLPERLARMVATFGLMTVTAVIIIMASGLTLVRKVAFGTYESFILLALSIYALGLGITLGVCCLFYDPKDMQKGARETITDGLNLCSDACKGELFA